MFTMGEDSLLQDMMLTDTSPNLDRGLIPMARPHWGNSVRSRSINFNQVCFINILNYRHFAIRSCFPRSLTTHPPNAYHFGVFLCSF